MSMTISVIDRGGMELIVVIRNSSIKTEDSGSRLCESISWERCFDLETNS